MATETLRPSSYLSHLPQLYREDPFLGLFLVAFEQVLTGGREADFEPDVVPLPGLEQMIGELPALLDPKTTRSEFLPWLAGWVALSLRADWSAEQGRQFIGRIVPLYQRRGTKANLQELLEIYTGVTPEIQDAAGVALQIGVRSTIGTDTYLEGSRPHYFEVHVNLPADLATIARQREIITALIDMEKPAHTTYNREDPDLIRFPTMQIGRTSTIGVDTLLGDFPGAP
jgi:phage tail-like protein